ncbi:MAG: hypothetical protein HY877_00550 [Deltaproteobacteria bacterium]|nr:hypothetical protein [Deltaproteobacteria bacterium]
MKINYFCVLSGLLGFSFLFPVMAEEKTSTKCHMNFTLNSWSVFYKSGKGDGTITCDNGQSASVRIRTHGGGITFGKSKILDGVGTFSKVNDIQDLFGGYAESEAHAGVSASGDVHAMWKGDVSLAISGTGKGWNLGINFGSFKISPK